MKITVCGSITFAEQMLKVKERLDNIGHKTFIPGNVEICSKYVNGEMDNIEKSVDKIENDRMGKHIDLILSTDAVLILNYDKKGIKNYIGGNTFIEMVFAKYFKKDIFLLNDMPKESPYKDEIMACQPTILNGDFSKIKLEKSHKPHSIKTEILEKSSQSLKDSFSVFLDRIEKF